MSQVKNHFEQFGLQQDYEIDLDMLSRVYRQLQSTVHPDRFATAPQQQRRLALQQAAQINDGYQILKDPLRRARYLLELHGVLGDDALDTAMEPSFLLEQMELRETLAEVTTTRDPLATLDEIAADIRHRIADLSQQLIPLLAEQEPSGFEEAREVTRKLQFLYKLREEAAEKTAELEDGSL